jgi:hypothetical protein
VSNIDNPRADTDSYARADAIHCVLVGLSTERERVETLAMLTGRILADAETEVVEADLRSFFISEMERDAADCRRFFDGSAYLASRQLAHSGRS